MCLLDHFGDVVFPDWLTIMRTFVRVVVGSAHVLFRQAVASGNLAWVRTVASQMPRVALGDALRICLLMRDGNPELFDRAAVRWLGRFALEARGVTVRDLRAAAELLDLLRDAPEPAMERLSALCLRFGLG